jgi:anti-anti-sigma regulatory factor
MNTFPEGRTRRLELVGKYALGQKGEIAALFGALSPDGPATIDMSRVTYLDSTFLHELTRLRARLTPHRITLLVRSESIRRLLRLAKFDPLFEIQSFSDGV